MIELIRIDIDVNEHIWYERLSNITQIKVDKPLFHLKLHYEI
jgi:hypothetical protein